MILLCAATSTEAKACERGLARAKPGLYETLRTGMGLQNAERALKMRLSQPRLPEPSHVISTGFAGLWRGDRPIGSWLQAESIALYRGSEKALATQILFTGETEVAQAPFFSVKDLETRPPEDVEGLRVAVDMESWALAQVCAHAKIPFSILRMVTDTPAQPLPRFVGAFSQAFLSQNARKKAAFGVRGVHQMMAEPFGLYRLFSEGPGWARDLARGWEKFNLRITRGI